MGDTNGNCCVTTALVLSLLALVTMVQVENRVTYVHDRINDVIRYTETISEKVDRMEATHGLPSQPLDNPVCHSNRVLVQALAQCQDADQLQTFVNCLGNAMERNVSVT